MAWLHVCIVLAAYAGLAIATQLPLGCERYASGTDNNANANKINNITADELLNDDLVVLHAKYPNLKNDHVYAPHPGKCAGLAEGCFAVAAWNWQTINITSGNTACDAITTGACNIMYKFKTGKRYKIIPIIFYYYIYNHSDDTFTEQGFAAARYVFYYNDLQYSPGEFEFAFLDVNKTIETFPFAHFNYIIDPLTTNNVPLYSYDALVTYTYDDFDFTNNTGYNYAIDTEAEGEIPTHSMFGPFINITLGDVACDACHNTKHNHIARPQQPYINYYNSSINPATFISENTPVTVADVPCFNDTDAHACDANDLWTVAAADDHANLTQVPFWQILLANETLTNHTVIDMGNATVCHGSQYAETCWPVVEFNFAPFIVSDNGCNIATTDCTNRFQRRTIYHTRLAHVSYINRAPPINEGYTYTTAWVRYVFAFVQLTNRWTFQWVDVGTADRPLAEVVAIENTEYFALSNVSLRLWNYGNYTAVTRANNAGYNYALTDQNVHNTCGSTPAPMLDTLSIDCDACYNDHNVGYTYYGKTVEDGVLVNTAPDLVNIVNPSGVLHDLETACVGEVVTTLCLIPVRDPPCLRGEPFMPLTHSVRTEPPAVPLYWQPAQLAYSSMNRMDPNDILNCRFAEYDREGLALLPGAYSNPAAALHVESWVVAWWDFEPLYINQSALTHTDTCVSTPGRTPFDAPCAGQIAGGDTFLYKIVPMIVQSYTIESNGHANSAVNVYVFTFAYNMYTAVGWQFVSISRNDWTGITFLGHYAIGLGTMPLVQVEDMSENLNTGRCTGCGYDVITSTDITGTTPLPPAAVVAECGAYSYVEDLSYCNVDSPYQFSVTVPVRTAFYPLVNYNVVGYNFSALLGACGATVLSLACDNATYDTPLMPTSAYLLTVLENEIALATGHRVNGVWVRVAIVRILETDLQTNYSDWTVDYILFTDTANDHPVSGIQTIAVTMARVSPTPTSYSWVAIIHTAVASKVISTDDAALNATACVSVPHTTTCTPAACGGTCTNYTYNRVTQIGINSLDATQCTVYSLTAYDESRVQSAICVGPEAASIDVTVADLLKPDRVVQSVGFALVACFVAVSYGVIAGLQKKP